MRRRTRSVIAGTLLAPVPMVGLLLLAVAVTVGFEVPALVWIMLACLATWLPLLVSYVILRILGRRSLRAYATVMFAVTFTAMLSIVLQFDFRPDAYVSANVNGDDRFYAAFSITGVLIAVIAGALNAAGMALFYRKAVQSCVEPETKNS